MELNISNEAREKLSCDKASVEFKTNDGNDSEVSGFSSVLKVFALDYSTAHGLPNIYKARSTFGRLLWTVLFFGGSIAVLVQMYFLVDRYFSYDTTTQVRLWQAKTVITYCHNLLLSKATRCFGQ